MTTDNNDSKVKVYLFGAKSRQAPDITPSELLKWMSGVTVPMTEALHLEVLQEFGAQDTYRQTLLSGIQKVCAQLLEAAGKNVYALETPSEDLATNYWRGYGCGKYEAYCEAAGALSELALIAAQAVK